MHKKQGFTLIETILYVAIVGLVAASIMSFSITISRSRAKQDVLLQVNQDVRYIDDTLRRLVETSRGVSIAQSTFDTDPSVLTLTMDDVSKNPTVVELTQDNGRMKLTEGANSPIFLSSNNVQITHFVLTHMAGGIGDYDSVRSVITVEYNSSTDPLYQYSVSATSTYNRR